MKKDPLQSLFFYGTYFSLVGNVFLFFVSVEGREIGESRVGMRYVGRRRVVTGVVKDLIKEKGKLLVITFSDFLAGEAGTKRNLVLSRAFSALARLSFLDAYSSTLLRLRLRVLLHLLM